jgi:hypothetical protein
VQTQSPIVTVKQEHSTKKAEPIPKDQQQAKQANAPASLKKEPKPQPSTPIAAATPKQQVPVALTTAQQTIPAAVTTPNGSNVTSPSSSTVEPPSPQPKVKPPVSSWAALVKKDTVKKQAPSVHAAPTANGITVNGKQHNAKPSKPASPTPSATPKFTGVAGKPL